MLDGRGSLLNSAEKAKERAGEPAQETQEHLTEFGGQRVKGSQKKAQLMDWANLENC